LVPRPAVSELVWLCKFRPAQAAGHDRFNCPPETVAVICPDPGAATEVTVTDPSSARLLVTAKPGDRIVIAAPPVTG